MHPPLELLLLLSLHLTPIFATLIFPMPDTPPCVQACEDKTDMSNVPLCAINPPQTSENDFTNTISCLCTDRHLLASTIPCVLRSCAGNSSSIETYFTTLYTLCHTHGHTHYPPPPHLLRALGITAPPNATIPATVSGVPINSAFPEVAAVTTHLRALPTQNILNALAAEAENGTGSSSGTGKVEVVGHGMGVAGAGVVGVAVVGVVVLVVLVAF
ncbi:uncharacterized protein H6S33_003518 [Morchella sextelata]|uniref:uncharacterized protein n=1 Tax=Morchella sextelata TaxID=1174677 RepID=UPI001D03CB99|nr:uncharacterized protein H6S33_003518 [Morchella sextelata]KAH0606684.1 hypothetical protein H6S33_003518 [Morchella sextelata]